MSIQTLICGLAHVPEKAAADPAADNRRRLSDDEADGSARKSFLAGRCAWLERRVEKRLLCRQPTRLERAKTVVVEVGAAEVKASVSSQAAFPDRGRKES